jgi:hypothetical protein
LLSLYVGCEKWRNFTKKFMLLVKNGRQWNVWAPVEGSLCAGCSQGGPSIQRGSSVLGAANREALGFLPLVLLPLMLSWVPSWPGREPGLFSSGSFCEHHLCTRYGTRGWESRCPSVRMLVCVSDQTKPSHLLFSLFFFFWCWGKY